MRVKCLAQEHKTMALARVQTRTTCYRVKHTNHETIIMPYLKLGLRCIFQTIELLDYVMNVCLVLFQVLL